MRGERTLVQTLASQLSSLFDPVLDNMKSDFSKWVTVYCIVTTAAINRDLEEVVPPKWWINPLRHPSMTYQSLTLFFRPKGSSMAKQNSDKELG